MYICVCVCVYWSAFEIWPTSTSGDNNNGVVEVAVWEWCCGGGGVGVVRWNDKVRREWSRGGGGMGVVWSSDDGLVPWRRRWELSSVSEKVREIESDLYFNLRENLLGKYIWGKFGRDSVGVMGIRWYFFGHKLGGDICDAHCARKIINFLFVARICVTNSAQ